MKFSLALISLFCVSAIFAAPVEKSDPSLDEAIRQVILDAVESFERTTPGWETGKSLEDNVIQQVNNKLKVVISDWNPDLTIEENLEYFITNLLASLYIPSLNMDATLSKNIYDIVDLYFGFFDRSPSKEAENTKMVVINTIKAMKVSNLDVSKSLKVNINALVATAVIGIKVDPEDPLKTIIDSSVTNALQLIKLPGYSSKATSRDNMNLLIQEIIKNVDLFFH